MPNLADKPMQLAKDQLEDSWNIPAKDFHAMTVKTRKGTIMGRVRADCWRTASRIYYQVCGPVPPSAEQNDCLPKDYIFCEAEYRDGQNCKVEKYMRDGATKLWKYRGQATARSAVAAGRYKINIENNNITLTFWTPKYEPVDTVRFRYQEDNQEGHMDLRPYKWPVAAEETAGSPQ